MNHNNLIGANLRRTLMLSPGQQETPPGNVGLVSRSRREKELEQQTKTDQTFMKVSFERYISQVLSSSEMEAHEQRLKKIGDEARNLSKDEWMFTPVEKLLGNWTST